MQDEGTNQIAASSGSSDNLPKPVNEQQQSFLDAYFDFTEGSATFGDVRASMDVAGYSPRYSSYELMKNLEEDIRTRFDMFFLVNGPKAMMGLMQVLHDPKTPGNDIKLRAIKEVLDRGGIGKNTDTSAARENRGSGTTQIHQTIYLPEKRSDDGPAFDGVIDKKSGKVVFDKSQEVDDIDYDEQS